MNDFNNLSAESEVSALAHVGPNEDFDFHFVGADEEAQERDEQAGWPGDGSGMDDFADFNANEANDYMNE